MRYEMNHCIRIIALLLVVTIAPYCALAQDDPEITIALDLPEGAIPLQMVRIPAGTFLFGTPHTDPDRWVEEWTPHEVTLTKDFYISRYEITQAQYQAVMGVNPSYHYGHPNHPVERVDWYDIQGYDNDKNDGFVEKLAEKGLGVFRLPTEAEWEYACRAGTETRYYWGDDPGNRTVTDHAWIHTNARWISQEVGLMPPNPWGLYDMAGNVFEWCLDGYSRDTKPGPRTDPLFEDNKYNKVIRGGGYSSNAHRCRSSWRYYDHPSTIYGGYGFRIVKEIEEIDEGGAGKTVRNQSGAGSWELYQ